MTAVECVLDVGYCAECDSNYDFHQSPSERRGEVSRSRLVDAALEYVYGTTGTPGNPLWIELRDAAVEYRP